jgi:hypothetical protein
VFGIFDLISYSQGPSRRTQRSLRNSDGVHGHICFDGTEVGYESALERLFALMMALDPQVLSIIHQPLTYSYRVTKVDKLLHYTPDYRIIRDSTRPWIWGNLISSLPEDCLFEVKPIERLMRLSASAVGPRASLAAKIQESGTFGFRFFTNQTMPNHVMENILRIGSANPSEVGLKLGRVCIEEVRQLDRVCLSDLAEAITQRGFAPTPILLGLMRQRAIVAQYQDHNFLEVEAAVYRS